MKTLILGSLAFFVWSSFSTYYYVCDIKNLCPETTAVALKKPAEKTSALPENLEKETAPEESPGIAVSNPGSFTIHHHFNQASFAPDDDLSQYLDLLKTYTEQTQATILLIGFTDNVGQSDYNMDLGEKRAEEVKKYLIGQGLDSEKIQIETEGATHPLSSNNSSSGRANNRRTEIHIQE